MKSIIDDNRYQLHCNRLMLIIDEQSITKIFVIIDCHRLLILPNRLPMGIDQLSTLIIDRLSVSIDYRWESKKANVSHYDSWERESLQRSLSPLTPTWNNFLLLSESLLGIPHGRSRWKWTYAQKYPERHIKKEEEEEITISLIVCKRWLRPRLIESLQWTQS